ncbi:MAG: carbohydrate kinase family protein [Candidatus ainarchaeum sp.]|nr:carbohydrate kinase family protein [Candidatus ainarchaeum sp.]
MKVYAIGDICLDVLCSIRERAALGEEKHIHNLVFSLGGNAANFAFAAAKLGLDVELFSAIGNDFATGFLKKSLKGAGVKSSMKPHPMQNSYSIHMIEKNGQRFSYSTKGPLEKLSSGEIEKKLLPRLKQGDIVFFGGYFHILELHKGFSPLLKKIKSKGCLIAFDLCFDEYGEWKILDFAEEIDFLFMNEIELGQLTKKSSEKEAIKLLFKKGASNIILKKGPNGSEFFSHCASFREKAPRVKAADTTGAGDIFNAAFLKAFIEGKDAKACLKFANFVASAKVARHGLFVPSQRILKQKLHN